VQPFSFFLKKNKASIYLYTFFIFAPINTFTFNWYDTKTERNKHRLNITILLITMSLFSIGLSITRAMMTDTKVFLFLNWNLFLALIPWLLSSLLVLKGLNSKGLVILLILVWLAFFPNSPYILTDLFHLKLREGVPMWFDLVLILSFAWTGLLYGFISLKDIESLLKKYTSGKLIFLLSIVFLFMSAFGIFLGRYLRWNSWDIISNPMGLFNDIAVRFADPVSFPNTWGMTILMGILLNMMYLSFKFIRKTNTLS